MRWLAFPVLLLGLWGCTSSGGAATPCVPGENRCFGNNLGTCGSDGATWALGFCGTERTCVEGRCVPLVCVPGRATCADEWTEVQCLDGLQTRTVPCALGDKCYEAGCLPEKCTPGEIRCLFDTLVICAASAQGAWVAVPCPEGKACKGDECVQKVCIPRSGTCVPHPDQPGVEIGLTCGLNGSEWASQTVCTSDEVCREGFCFPKTAPPPPPTDAGPTDEGQDPGSDFGPTEDLAVFDDPGPPDPGPLPDMTPPPNPNRAVVNGVAVVFDAFVKVSIIAGEVMVTLQSSPVDGVPFPHLEDRRQTIELHFPGLAAGTTGTFRCEDDSVRLWYRFGKYMQGGECKDYDYYATKCIVTIAEFAPDGTRAAGTFDLAELEDCVPGGPPITIVDGHFLYEK